MISPHELRELLIRGLPEERQLYGQWTPHPYHVHFPPSHFKALRADAMVVVGMCGAGRSFWWRALRDPTIRKLLAQVDRFADANEQTEIGVGFGEQIEPERFPDSYTLESLLHKSYPPDQIWRAVVVHNLFPGLLEGDWENRVQWVKDHPEEVARRLEEKDKELDRRGIWSLILFDALDRAATRWEDIYRLIRGLLQVALYLRPTRRIRIKCFLRTDQMVEAKIATFPDASKVIGTRVTLSWPRYDLYSLLWQYLANADGAEPFRELGERTAFIQWGQIILNGHSIWRWPPRYREDEDRHRKLFHAIAGPWMGRDSRRGFPYTWLPGHLADAYGQTSPRSFLLAVRAAAEDTQQRHPDHEYALHYESIKRGVQQASQGRVQELREDYPWVDPLMQPLRGLLVPLEFGEITACWDRENVLQKLEEWQGSEEVKLPPAHLQEGYEGIRKDLEELGIFYRLEDGRVNIPDVFRVVYGLGRKGGVKPIQKLE